MYTASAGATSAFPGEVIASATWNSVFADIQAALTQLGQQQLYTVNAPRVITSYSAFTVNLTDRVVLIEAAVGTVFLPLASTKLNPVTFIGAGGTIFGSGNAVLLPTSPDTIDGLLKTTLTGNYQSITLLPLPSGGWLVY